MLDLLVPMMLMSVGFGLAMPALTGLGMSGATAEDSGIVSGLFNTTMQVGAAIGAAVLITLSAARTDGLRGAGEPLASALTSGYHLAFGIGAGLVTVALIVAATVLKTEKPEPQEIEAKPQPQPVTG